MIARENTGQDKLRAAVGNLWPAGRVQAIICFCTVPKLRMVFTFF